jgi:methylenetetrahydrofolate reductase (NADPH)
MPFAQGVTEAAALPQPVRLSVSCSPKHGVDRTLEVATQLRMVGHEVTVHLAAKMVRDRVHLGDLLTGMKRAGIHDAFVIGGDAPAAVGPFASAVQLLPIIHEHPDRPRSLGIAGYPEGHPQIDARTLAVAMEEKSRFADYMTTQLCFDSKKILSWIEGMRKAGSKLPVVLGIPGIIDRQRLLEISLRIGVGASLGFLRKQGLARLLRLSTRSAESLHQALLPRVGDPSLGVAGFHYFTFNKVMDTWRWVQGNGGCGTAIHDNPQEGLSA